MSVTMTEDEAIKIATEFREDYLKGVKPVRHANTHELLHALMLIAFRHLRTRDEIARICGDVVNAASDNQADRRRAEEER